MMRQSSCRNQRSKGLKVKNVLQLCLLAAVCFWLLYQLKRSYEKKMALEERNLVASEKIAESQLEFLKLGRKDLPDLEENSSENYIHDKEEGNEEEEQDQEIKQAMEDEEIRGDGDDEIDEQDQDQESAEEEAENGEELINEEDKDSQGEEMESMDDQEEDSSHKAREESYKRDDVSNAVLRENQAKTSEDEDGGAGEEALENTEEKYVDADDMADGADDASKADDDLSVGAVDVSKVNITGVVLVGSKTDRDDYPNMKGTVMEKKVPEFGNSGLNNSEGSLTSNQRELQANSTTAYVSDNHIEAQANSTSADSNNQTGTQSSSMVSDAVGGSVPLWNEAFVRDSVQKHNVLVEMESSERNKINLKNVVMEGLAERSNATVGQEDAGEHSSVSLGTLNNGGPIQGDFAGSSHKMVTEEDRDALIDLSTLPAMQNEAKIMVDVAVE